MKISGIHNLKNIYFKGKSNQQYPNTIKKDSFERTTTDNKLIEEIRLRAKKFGEKLGFTKEEIEDLETFADSLNKTIQSSQRLYFDSLFSIMYTAQELGTKDINQLKTYVVLDKVIGILDEDEMDEFRKNPQYTNDFIKLTEIDKGNIPSTREAIDIYTIIKNAKGDKNKLEMLLNIYKSITETYKKEDLYSEWLDRICKHICGDKNKDRITQDTNSHKANTEIKIGPNIFFQM